MGHASDLIADRVSPSNMSEDKLDDLYNKVKEISIKIEMLKSSHPATANRIVIKSCHPDISHPKQQQQHSASKTDQTGDDMLLALTCFRQAPAYDWTLC